MNRYVSISSVLFVFLICAVVVLLILLIISVARNRKIISNYQSELHQSTSDLELQVEKAKAAADAKSDFLSRMSHEIRTPLNAIMGMTQIARSNSTEKKVIDSLDKMEDSTKHLLGVINDILDFSKIESDKMTLDEKPFSLQLDMDFIVSLFKTRIAEKNIDFTIKLENIINDSITTDMLRLNQVLINLLSNAVKFTENGGRIILTVEELVHFDGESVYRFIVKDNGVGIEPEQARKLFTPFTQAHSGVTRMYGGTGLGLSISQSIVEMMGGEIELDTKPGAGSEFRFTIRAKASDAPLEKHVDRQKCAPPEKIKGKHILIVDDVEINLEVTAALIEDSGALIETAENGQKAIDAFCSSELYWYDMILMDMQMPVMDGCAATMEIRDSGRADSGSVKIIAMTANVLPEDQERAMESGMNGYLTKPIEREVLFSKMEELL